MNNVSVAQKPQNRRTWIVAVLGLVMICGLAYRKEHRFNPILIIEASVIFSLVVAIALKIAKVQNEWVRFFGECGVNFLAFLGGQVLFSKKFEPTSDVPLALFVGVAITALRLVRGHGKLKTIQNGGSTYKSEKAEFRP